MRMSPRALAALTAAATVGLLASLGSTPAAAANPKALILGSTVSPCSATTGCPQSLEEEQAAADGFDVTVVDDSTWDAMTAADFAAYQVLIIGDPTCGNTVDGAAATNTAVWQPVVMASGGNKVIIGTDPVYHHYAHPGATTLIKNGIAFAGAVPGATGAYVDISCDSSFTNSSTPFSFLDGLTTQAAGSFTTEYAPCFGAISIVAQSGPTTGLHDTDLSDWFCSVHQDFKTWASDYTPLAIATDAATKTYCANDVDTGALACGAPYILVSGSGVVVTSSISLTPATATNPLGASHTVTATIKDSSSTPVPGKTVTFSVVSGPDTGASGTCVPVTCVTDSNGQTTFTYTNNGTAGTDTISASFIDDLGALEKATATKTWGVIVEKKPTSTTYTGGSSVQYSDSVTLSGTLLDTSVSPNVGIAGKQLDFTLGTQTASASPTDASGNGSTSLVVTQKPGSATSVATSFAGDSTYATSNDSDPFTITKEDCTLAYSGDVIVPPATMTTLAADMGEPDSSLGDRSNKTVTFTVVDAALNTQTFTATTDASGHASMSVALPDGVYGVSVSFSGDDFYLPCATATDTLVTVQAAAAKVTGGGWISIGTGRTSFGFNAIPIAGGGFRGQFQLRSNNGKNRFHGNVVSSLSGSGNTATWSGTGRWNGTAGYTYTISVVDNGSSGAKKGDTISITIKSPSNAVVYSTGGPQTLKGGNITVH
jgi:hypothetical protein